MRITSAGTTVYTKLIGSTNSQSAYAIAVDSTNAVVYLTGYTTDSLFGETKGAFWDMFLIKLSTNGTAIWCRLADSGSDDISYGVAVDSAGAALITGMVGTSIFDQTSAGDYDIFLSKYSSTGSRSWTRLLGDTSRDEGRAI
eukprot:gene52734-64434_t